MRRGCMDNKILFIGYDYHIEGKAGKSLAIASLQASIEKYLPRFTVESYSFDVNKYQTLETDQLKVLMNILEKEYKYIAISYYAWNKSQCINLVELIKELYPESVIILGGYEVNGETLINLEQKFGDRVDHYIVGYAEEAIISILEGKTKTKIANIPLKTIKVPPVYSSGVINLEGISNVRIETKRGCPMQCSYCSYSSNDHKSRIVHDIDTVKQEFDFLNGKVDKVNIIDPIFTIDNYKDVLDHLISIDFKPVISFQVKFELFYRLMRKTDILDKLKKLNTVLEFGFQTGSESVHKLMHRDFEMNKVIAVIRELTFQNIQHEISVIRGLPGETLLSYRNMIDYFIEQNIENIEFFPLTLLSNTRMSDESNMLGIKTYTQKNLNFVCETHSYSVQDYQAMKTYEKQYG